MAVSGDSIDGDQLLEVVSMSTTPGKPSQDSVTRPSTLPAQTAVVLDTGASDELRR